MALGPPEDSSTISLYGGMAAGIILLVAITVTVICAVMLLWKKHRKYVYHQYQTGFVENRIVTCIH